MGFFREGLVDVLPSGESVMGSHLALAELPFLQTCGEVRCRLVGGGLFTVWRDGAPPVHVRCQSSRVREGVRFMFVAAAGAAGVLTARLRLVTILLACSVTR